jgi:hypothetical protein
VELQINKWNRLFGSIFLYVWLLWQKLELWAAAAPQPRSAARRAAHLAEKRPTELR